ncbi:MAG: 3-phosphoshikimate 1-carboxyvinyltransferase, partial [Marmoricola sp.]
MQVPNSKYHAHRALILASLADGTSRISGLSDAKHVHHTMSLLRSLGVHIETKGTDLEVHGGAYRAAKDTVSAGSSGTTLYFMTGLVSLADRDVVVTGQKYFTRRPIAPLLDALRQMGVSVDSPNDCPPIRVGARPPTGGEVHIDGTLSQWISGLLLLAPFATGPTTIVVDGALNERHYLELTLQMMKQFGLQVEVTDGGHRYLVEPQQRAQPTHVVLPADIGSAAFGFAAAGTHPADIVLRGLHHTRTSGVDHPEASLLDILARMGMPMAYDEHA